jgi:superoxide dismutase, Fe-Mn family
MKLKEYIEYAGELRYELQPLPYEYDALEPKIDEATMREHHTKHQQKYVDKLNEALDGTPYMGQSLETLFLNARALPDDIRNNAGGVWNHQFFWSVMTPVLEMTEMSDNLADAIVRDYGSIEDFRETFKETALNHFGSGWVWLVKSSGRLRIVTTPNQDNPLMHRAGTPIIGCDLWEHAYYLKHKSDRGKWVDTFLKVCNWNQASKNFSK